MMCETNTGSNHPSFGSLSVGALEHSGFSKSMAYLLAISESRASRLEAKEGIMLYMSE
jgi:hypothetical protein